jgi:chorismate synthase
VAELKKILVSLPDSLLREVDEIVAIEKKNRSEFIREAMKLYIRERHRLEIKEKMKKGYEEDSAGGVVECLIEGLPSGVGEPVFEKLDAALAKAVFSIGAVKGFEIGSGFEAAALPGSCHNDPYRIDEGGCLTKLTNHAGGIVGGISDGFPIVFRAAFKPTPSIHAAQKSVDKQGSNVEIQIEGRHDPIIVPRAVIVVEAMTAVTLLDYLFQRILSRMDLIKKALE